MGSGAGGGVVTALPRDSAVDGAWVVIGRFNGLSEVWRGGVFEEEADALEAFKAHAEQCAADGLSVELLHAARIEIDRSGLPSVRAPGYRPEPAASDADAASYAIANVGDPSLRWSNADGWTDGTDYAVFSASERGVLSLPIDGAWVPAPTAD